MGWSLLQNAMVTSWVKVGWLILWHVKPSWVIWYESLFSFISNYMISRNYSYLIIINLHSVIWFQVFLPNINKVVGNCSWRWPEGFLFDSYNTKVERRVLLLSLDCSTLPLILTRVLSKVASSTIFWVLGMTWLEIEPRSPGPLANTLTVMPIYSLI